MEARRIIFVASAVVFAAALGLLVTGSPLLVLALAPGVPLGTPITWAGMVALPTMMLTGLPGIREPRELRHRVYAGLFKALIVLAVAWGLVAYGLAGNWSYNFSSTATGFRGSPQAGVYFGQLNAMTLGLPLLTLVIYGAHQLLVRLLGRGTRDGGP